MRLEFINEFQIDQSTSEKLNALLQKCFPEVDYEQRDYFKQLPHYRILLWQEQQIIGQLGIDFRVMRLNENAVNVFGLIDLCVDPEFRAKGLAKALLAEFERIARTGSYKVDFLFLVSDSPEFYEKLGYKRSKLTSTWLKMDRHSSYGLGKEQIQDVSFLVKSISNKIWEDGDLDMLGYMY